MNSIFNSNLFSGRFETYEDIVTKCYSVKTTLRHLLNNLCAWRHNMPPPFSPLGAQKSASHATEQTQRSSTFPRRIRSHTLTAAAALRVKAALSKWRPGDLWPF